MSKTWREAPKGPPKDPRPPEKGGHKNLYREALEKEFYDDSPDWEELAELANEV
jgi:hypothetical protein